MKSIIERLFCAWDDFWFKPRSAHTLAVIRIATGAMLAYIHFIWWLRIDDFLGPEALIGNELSRKLHESDFAWSYLWSIESPTLFRLHQWLAVLVSIGMCLGCLTRITVPLAWFLTLMVCHRMTGFLFGLDQVVMMLAMYLIVAPAGSLWSLDAIWGRRLRRRQIAFEEKSDRAASTSQVPHTLPPPTSPGSGRFKVMGGNGCMHWLFPDDQPSAVTTLSMRLMQIHLCIVYLFGGLAKLRGEMWWDGSAMWFSLAAYEYQSLDMTWLGRFPTLTAVLTHLTVFWETFYCFLVWRRPWRPIMLGLAVAVHGGIALFLGMVTFGFMMIVANLAFVEPSWLQSLFRRPQQGESTSRSPSSIPPHNSSKKSTTRVRFVLLAVISMSSALSSHAVEAPNERAPTKVGSKVLVDIFNAEHNGWSLDEVLLSDTRRAAMLNAVRLVSTDADEKSVWEELVRLRKSGKLHSETTKRESTDYGDALPAAEIAARRLQDEFGVTFDQALIDPVLLKRYDELAHSIDATSDTYTLRKAALRLRKSRRLQPELVTRVVDWQREIVAMPLEQAKKSMDKLPTRPGIYIFRDAGGYLYVGQSNNLRERLGKHLVESDRKNLAKYLAESTGKEIVLELHVFLAGSPAEQNVVREAYESELIRTRKPKLNLSP